MVDISYVQYCLLENTRKKYVIVIVDVFFTLFYFLFIFTNKQGEWRDDI